MNNIENSTERRTNQFKLLSLWLIPLGLMAIAGLVYSLVQSGQITLSSKNEGVLIQPPVQLNDLAFVDPQTAEPVAWGDRWTMVVRGGASCDARCQETLMVTRQIHIRLDKNANRVKRVYVSDALPLSAEFLEHVELEHRYLRVLSADAKTVSVLDNALRSDDGDDARFFLVDPQGWAMMYYQEAHEGNAILKDLKHLLKFSRER